jgi:hypothetical protein
MSCGARPRVRPLAPSTRIMEREEHDRHNVENRRRSQYEADYSHLEEGAQNLDHQPRSQIVAPA